MWCCLELRSRRYNIINITYKYTVPEYPTAVAAEFFYKLYSEPIITQTRDNLIFHLLNAITDGRSQTQITNQLIKQVDRIIQSKPIILPRFQDEILQLIKIWKNIQPIIT